jgi:L-2-hydroxyglutarate oxidase LhgO
MREDAEKEGIQICSGVQYLRRDGDSIQTSARTFRSDFLVNCSGLHADQVASDFGFSKEYRILPFKGLYLYSNEATGAFKTNIYPVPDLRNPFLGVHFTITVDGHAKIGPTAIPAFWREQYGGLDRFSLAEFAEIAWRDAGLFLFAGFDFRRLAIEEIRKYSRPHLVELAGEIASDVRPENYVKWGKPGIRAQLMHLKSRKLEMDFVVEGDSNSFHVLNAVSPAWTCSLPFAEYVVDELERRRQPKR